MKELKPLTSDSSEVVTWIHLGDLHMVRSGEQNHKDLQAIVEEINAVYAGKGVSFVYLPGDIADDGSTRAYGAVRECLDKLKLPWCAIVGDHDVHERSFQNFETFMSESLYGSFAVSEVRFFRLNTFSEPRPDSFIVDDVQLDWLDDQLKQCREMPVVLMHCYPSDLKQGRERLAKLLREYKVRVVDMGHTHYNEISNDGTTIYCAARSTGQIEEGPVGYAVLSLDGDAFSWHFARLGSRSMVDITSPADARLLTDAGSTQPRPREDIRVHARVWSDKQVASVELYAFGICLPMELSNDLWMATIAAADIVEGESELTVKAKISDGTTAEDNVRLSIGICTAKRTRSEVDAENTLGEWPERDLLGTQLGPNKNGRKW